MKYIPGGYNLKIETYENDWDGNQTVDVYGLSAASVICYLDILELFRSGPETYGNLDISPETQSGLITQIEIIIAECKHRFLNLPEIFESPEDAYYFVVDEMIGRWGYGGNYRVFEKVTVYNIPEKSIEDVTANFM